MYTIQRWSGAGEGEPGKIEVLTGLDATGVPKPYESGGAPTSRHTFIHARPEFDNPFAFNVYFFDVGDQLKGQVVELKFQQRLIDTAGIFKPSIAYTTRFADELERVSLKVSAPREAIFHPRGRALVMPLSELLSVGGTRAYAASPVRTREQVELTYNESDAQVTYEPSVAAGERYELVWATSQFS